MATDLKRFTISITPQMETDLDAVKQRLYYKDTRNAMIRDLIIRGLEALDAENRAQEENPGGCSKTAP